MEAKLNVKLLRHTDVPVQTIATAAKLCYSEAKIMDLVNVMDSEKSEKLVKKLVELGHFSPFEHVSFTFGIEGVSRALTHQLVRHRVASYSQQSQRYVDASDFSYITPPEIKKDKDAYEKFKKIMNGLNESYAELLKIAPKEDARYILPNAAETRIIVTMNARELLYFFRMRCCNRAQWEIREMAIEMLKLAKKAAPLIFEDAGPACVKGSCSEGKMTCGKATEVREFFKKAL